MEWGNRHPRATFTGALCPAWPRCHLLRLARAHRLGVRALSIIATVALSLAVGSCGDVPDAGRVVAEVNGTPITYGELMRELERRRGATVLLALIDEWLIREEAAKRGLTVTPEERRAGLERAAARVGSMADLEGKLRQAGIPMEAYQNQIETEILLDKIAAQETKVTEAEIRTYYREHIKEFQRGERANARMMLFADRASAEAVLEALRTPGSDFAGLAKSLSQDGATRDQGGDMGWFERGDYAPAITEVAFRLKPGELSPIIKAPDGWVILRGGGRKPAGPLPLEEVRDQIRQRLRYEKIQEVRSKWLIQARKNAELIISSPELRKAVEPLLETAKPPPMPGEL